MPSELRRNLLLKVQRDKRDPHRSNLVKVDCFPFFVACSAPESNLELQWAFGFNSTASRGAVHYSAKGNMVVGSGSAGVVTHQVGPTFLQ